MRSYTFLSKYPNDYDLGKVVIQFGLDKRLIKKYPNYRELGNRFRTKCYIFLENFNK
jgi:hypothetical protein